MMVGPGLKSEEHPHGWSARHGHTATKVGSYLYVFGGSNDDVVKSRSVMRMSVLPKKDRLRLDGTYQYEWTILPALKGNAPGHRYGHNAALISGRYYTIFGGFVGTKNAASNDVVVLDLGDSEDIGNSCQITTDKEGDVCKWVSPEVGGTEPLARQYAASTVLGKKRKPGKQQACCLRRLRIPQQDLLQRCIRASRFIRRLELAIDRHGRRSNPGASRKDLDDVHPFHRSVHVVSERVRTAFENEKRRRGPCTSYTDGPSDHGKQIRQCYFVSGG